MRRTMFTLALIGLLLCAAWLTLGPPDALQALTFFAGGIPTPMAGEAVTILLAWFVILVAVLGLLGGALQLVAHRQILRRPSARAAILLMASLVLLVAGVVHHAIPAGSVCCGSDAADIREAISLAQ